MTTALLTFAGVVVVALSGLAGTVGASWISSRADRRASEQARLLDERKVSREDFDSITRELRESIAGLRLELAQEKAARLQAEKALMEEREARKAAETEARTAQRRVTALESRIARLEGSD